MISPWYDLAQLEMDATLETIREDRVRLGFQEPEYWNKEVM